MSLAYDHGGRWTADDVLALPEDDIRYEVVDGALIVNPPPSPHHQEASWLLTSVLRAAVRSCDKPARVWEAVGIKLPAGQLLIPDVVVGTTDGPRSAWPLLEPEEVLLVAEIVSPGSTTRDRHEKPVLYAEAGIRHFWRVELGAFRGRVDPLPVVFIYTLADDGDYKLVQKVGAGEPVRVTEPFPVDFDPADLVES